MKGKYLITTDCWFYAPDGRQYKAAWGDVEIIEDTFLGLKTNRNSSNWYAKCGSEQNHIIIAGCQIHYAIRCEEKPNTKSSEDWQSDAQNGVKIFERPSSIYIAGDDKLTYENIEHVIYAKSCAQEARDKAIDDCMESIENYWKHDPGFTYEGIQFTLRDLKEKKL